MITALQKKLQYKISFNCFKNLMLMYYTKKIIPLEFFKKAQQKIYNFLLNRQTNWYDPFIISFTSLMADIYQDIKIVSSFSTP